MLFEPASAAAEHITDMDIAGGLSSQSEKHIIDCAQCRVRMQVADTTPTLDDDEFLAAIRARGLRPEQNAWTSAVPSASVLALASQASRSDDVEPGQLWTVAWRGVEQMVAVVAIHRWQVQAAPVTTDTELADEFTLLIDANDSALEVPLAIWVRPTVTVPLFIFERQLAELGPFDGSSATRALRTVLASYQVDQPVPSDLPVGPLLTPYDYDRIALLDSLTQTMVQLANAQHCIQEALESQEAADSREADQPAVSITERLNQARIELSELSQRSGLSREELVAIKRNGQLTRAQAERLAAVLDTAPEQLLGPEAPAIPDELIVAASRPSRRLERRDWTSRRHPDAFYDDPMPLIHDTAYLPMAARSTPTHSVASAGHGGSGEQQAWDSRVAYMLKS
jgi:hypothetical protein